MSLPMRLTLSLLGFILLIVGILDEAIISQPDSSDPLLNSSDLEPINRSDAEFASGRVLVKFRDIDVADYRYIISEDEGASPGILLTEQGARAIKPLYQRTSSGDDDKYLSLVYILYLEPEVDVGNFITAFQHDPNVEWVEPDYLAYATEVVPNDPHFASQWGLDKIGATHAWDESTGSVSVPIAIIDSGISFTHPDLGSEIWVNPGEIPGNSIDDDNNGFIDDVNGWDFVNHDNYPSDDHGHGTHVAGIAAAASNNGAGISGVCWGCRVMPVKVMQSGIANYSDIAQGILYAAQKGAKVINVSLGGYSDSAMLHSAIQTAVDEYNSVVIAGAGNDNTSEAFYPAAYDEVLSVAGTAEDDTKTSVSNYGPWVDITSPADTITTTFLGGDYGPVSGTSYAAPFASGTAALLLSVNVEWSESLARAHIIQTVDGIDHLNPGLEGLIGGGRLNVGRAMTTSAEPLLTFESFAVDGVKSGRPTPGESFFLEVTLYNEWGIATNVQTLITTNDPLFSIDEGSSSFNNINPYTSETNTTSYLVEVDTAAPYGHSADFSLHVTASGGYVADIPFEITTRSETEYVSGLISTNTTWTSDKTYVVVGNILVQDSITLTIEPGTTILFHYYQLVVDGALQAIGTEESPIVFSSAQPSPSPQDWIGIRSENSGQVNLAHCEVAYAYNGLNSDGSASVWTIDNCYFHHNNIGVVDHAAINLRLENSRISFNNKGVITLGSGNIIRANDISYNGSGIHAGAGTISENIIHHNSEYGLFNMPTHSPVVISNTIIYNQKGAEINEPDVNFTQNNILSNLEYDLVAGGQNINVALNWWGTTDTSIIDQNIYDWFDDTNLGFVDYSPILTQPNPTAPAYLVDLSILPGTVLGIQTATFEAEFSRPMDGGFLPKVGFQTTVGNSENFNSSNSPLPDYDSCSSDIAVDGDNVKWVGTNEHGVFHYDEQRWITYDMNNSPVSRYGPHPIAFDQSGVKWIGNRDGLLRFDNSIWTLFDSQSTGIPYLQSIENVAVGEEGMVWASFSGPDRWQNDIARFDGVNWTYFDPGQTGLPNDSTVADIEVEANGSVWFSLEHDGVVLFDGTDWTIFDEHNSGLPSSQVTDAAIDSYGAKWFATGAGVVRYDGLSWKNFTLDSMGLGSNGWPMSIAIDESNTKWVGLQGSHPYRLVALTTDGESGVFDFPKQNPFPIDLWISDLAIDSLGNKWMIRYCDGLTALYGGVNYAVVDNPQWLNDHTWSATYDISSLIPRGEFKVIIGEAVGSDGLAIVPDSSYSFTVDYAGSIGDTSPPSVPLVDFCAGSAPSALSASWEARDPDSNITLYRHAIGTTPGNGEVINWAYAAASSIEYDLLNTISGETYYIAVQARNEAGLWSDPGIPPGVVAGSGMCTTNEKLVYLPSLRK